MSVAALGKRRGRRAAMAGFKPPTGITVPPRVKDIYRELSVPLHTERIRGAERIGCTTRVVSLARGYTVRIADHCLAQRLEASLRDFHRFMRLGLGLRASDSFPILIRLGRPAGCPAGLAEAFHARIDFAGCDVTVSDLAGARRALVWLEDEMTLRRAARLPRGEFRRWPAVLDRITRSPLAPYRWLSGWELEDDRDFYPEAYLNRLMHAGMNGIWVAGLLRRLVASRVLPELGPRRHRLDALKRLVAKAGRYGIRVFLFCIEPRAVPFDHPVFKMHPEIKGAGRAGDPLASLCTSTPLVQEYLRDVMGALFSAVPDLGGVINIFCGERRTNCWSAGTELALTCPRCRARAQTEVLAEELNGLMAGIRAASTTAKLLAWTYAMDFVDINTAKPVEPVLELMRRTHPEITWLANFEHGGAKRIGGKLRPIMEYALSYPGPSAGFRKIAGFAQTSRRRCYAKIQTGTTYELSSVPYLPLPGIVHAKIAVLVKTGATGTMASWIIGGSPSVMLKAVGEASFLPARPGPRFLERLAAIYAGPRQAKTLVRAWRRLAAGFGRYPFAGQVFYFGPITRAPAYQLHLGRETQLAQPYNWGLTRARGIQPFEDQVRRWCGSFTPEEIVRAFRALGRHWSQGLALLKTALRAGKDAELKAQWVVARAAGIQFASAANVFEFYQLRDQLRENGCPRAVRARLLGRMIQAVAGDLALARDMKRLLPLQASLGFQSEIYAYSYSRELLDAKIEHDRKTLAVLKTWLTSGVEAAVLARALPTPPPDTDHPFILEQARIFCRRGD